MISIKSDREIALMRVAGEAVSIILDGLEKFVEAGMTTADIDHFAEKRCQELGVVPAFKGLYGFPSCVCISVNEEVVHGIPSPKRTVKSGDLVSLDFGVSYQGWFGDSARTVAVGQVSKADLDLMAATRESLYCGIRAIKPGAYVSDIGAAVEGYLRPLGYGIVREYVGHGIGRALHEDPQVPNYGKPGQGAVLKAGMVIAIEPMVNQGTEKVKTLRDGWTVVTIDGKRSAHFEHTVLVTERGYEVLTVSPGQPLKI